MRILIGGGVRSGKSSFALALARRYGPRRIFVATAEVGDREMASRIARHARERGAEFRTLEVPVEVVDAVRGIDDADVVVLDCLTLWLSNLLFRGDSEDEIHRQVEGLTGTLLEKPFHAILVTNEVGMGIVPDSPLGRAFRDVSGRAHQALARAADEVFFGALGMIIRLRPAPLAVVVPPEDGK